jgi:hypothetical protein
MQAVVILVVLSAAGRPTGEKMPSKEAQNIIKPKRVRKRRSI